ncbi:exo-alpha-sialidase [Oxalobacteraceae bacterium OM1]|nr:exo-alpha-sialidase [Oxalobacteraceae bacterium OM1]
MSILLAMLTCAAAHAADLVWQPPVTVARGHGERGPWEQNNSRFDYVDDPAVALAADGDALVAYVDERSKDVFLRRFAPNGAPRFPSAVNVSHTPASFSWLPKLRTAGNKVYVLWQEILFGGGSQGGDMLFARSDDGGTSFSPAFNLTESASGKGKGRINKSIWHNGSYDLVRTSDGVLYATWTEYEGQLWFARSDDDGIHFNPAGRVTPSGAKPARAPSLAAGPGATVYLAWTNGDEEGADIHVARSDDAGRHFGPAVRVAPGPTYSDAPKIAVDAAGHLHLVYAESDGGPFGRYRILYTRSLDGGRTFEPVRNISRPLPERVTSAGFPSIAIDGRGHVAILFECFEASDAHPRGLGLIRSEDGGSTSVRPCGCRAAPTRTAA